MNYLVEAEDILKGLFFEDWMNEDDWKCFLVELEKASGISMISLSNNIEEGVKNGYSLENQINIINNVLKSE